MKARLSALLGESSLIIALRTQVAELLARQAAAHRLPPVLILGETGTGKGLLARTIHHDGSRHDQPLVEVNCAAIPETLLEAELFGYERGAFTDARQSKPGLFQAAHHGTLFLDEIGLLPVALQGKLLGVLEDRAVRRLGSTRAEPVDIALIAATSVDLKRAVSDGTFRADLYHRLAVISLELPPLRARGADVLALGEYFLARACADYGLSPRALTPDARDLLLAYPWPGNVRELANAMERVVLLSDTEAINSEMLDFLAGEAGPASEAVDAGNVADTTTGESLDAALRSRIEAALRGHGGKIRRTAAALGISRNTLRARMDKYGLRHRDKARGAARTESSRALQAPAPGPPLQWERRRLAFLRAQVRSSATVEAARALEMITEKVRSFGGRLEESGPTDVVAVFGLEPVDNAPGHAALAALAIQKAAVHASGNASKRLGVVVAIHCAEHLVSRHESTDQIGLDGKAATWSALETLVAGDPLGAIVISGAVVPFLTRRFALEPVREGPHEAWLVLRREDAPGAWSSPRFVGRASELETLRQASARAEQGRGQIVGIAGEAGVGKSRLLHECVRQLPGWHVLSSGGAPYATNTPYFPIVEMLKALCGVAETDAAADVQEKVARSLPAAAGDPDWLLPPVLDVLGALPSADAFRALDPSRRRQRTHDAVKQVLLAASLARPLCLIVEDLHWIDSETQAILDLLAESIAASRVMLLVNHRPEYRHGWGSRSAYSQVRLDPLATDGVEELLVALLGTDPSLGVLKQRLIERTEGNPFFLEESVRTLAETGVVVGETSAYRLGKAAGDFVLPMTVQAVIAARIDRLSREEKLVLQAAAVIGKDLRVAVLRLVAEVTDESFDTVLTSLRHAEFIHETRAHPDREYTLTHALTHEVAYGSLLQEQRRSLHAGIMEAIEREYPDRVAEQVDRLAHHALRGEVWPKALAYLRQAGARAATRSAYREAVTCFEQALVAVAHLPEGRETITQAIDVQLELQGPLAALGQSQKQQDYLGRAKDLAATLEDRSRLGRVLALECIYWRAALEFDRAIEAGERALAIATDLGQLDLQAITRYGLGVTFHDLGYLVRARDLLRWAVDALDQGFASPADPRGRHDPGGRTKGEAREDELPTFPGLEAQTRHMGLGLGLGPTTILVRPRVRLTLTLGYLGQFVEGISLGEEAIRIAESGGQELDCIIAAETLGSLYVIKGELDRAIPQLERSLALARAWSRVGWSTAGFLGLAYAQSARYDEAFRLVQELLGTSEEVVGDVRSSRFRQLGEIQLLAGHPAAASEHARQALDLARDRKQRGLEALALRLLAEVASHRDGFRPAEAEDYSRRALALAGELGMRPLIAQCHLDLGTLYRRTGRPEEAREHLTTATAMFREMDMTYWLEKSMAERRERS
jgi:DNA-binding NtrC family response regulator/tetratricopeptide (TPR) repeat protein